MYSSEDEAQDCNVANWIFRIANTNMQDSQVLIGQFCVHVSSGDDAQVCNAETMTSSMRCSTRFLLGLWWKKAARLFEARRYHGNSYGETRDRSVGNVIF